MTDEYGVPPTGSLYTRRPVRPQQQQVVKQDLFAVVENARNNQMHLVAQIVIVLLIMFAMEEFVEVPKVLFALPIHNVYLLFNVLQITVLSLLLKNRRKNYKINNCTALQGTCIDNIPNKEYLLYSGLLLANISIFLLEK